MTKLRTFGAICALTLMVCLFLPVRSFGQGGSIDKTTFGPTGTPKGGVAVTVCASTASVVGGVCTPAESDANCCFTDGTLSVRLATPPAPNQLATIVSDGLGNFIVWAAPGTYQVSYSGAGVTPKTTVATVSCVPGNSAQCGAFTNAVNNWSAQQNFNGGLGPYTAGKVNGVCIVDGVQNATLAAAVTCAGTNGVVDIPMFAVPTLTANVTIPAGVTLKFEGSSPGLITLGNFNLTINGPLVAPLAQIFSQTGTGIVTMGAGLGPIHAVWWGVGNTVLQSAFSACPASTIGCEVDADTSLSWAAPITVGPSDSPVRLKCTTNSDVNANPGGVLLTFLPTTTGQTGLAFTNFTRDWVEGCNITQGNTQASTILLSYQGTQGAGCLNSQVYGASLIDLDITDASSSSSEYNSFSNCHFIGFGSFNTSQNSCRERTLSSGHANNQITWFNSSCRLSTQGNLITSGGTCTGACSSSEDIRIGFDISGNSAILESIGDPSTAQNPYRNQTFLATTEENVSTAGGTASGTGTIATVTFTGQHGFANGQAVTVSGCSVGGYNVATTITALSGTPPNAFSYSNATTGAATGCIAQPTNQVGFALNGTALTDIQTEGGLTGPGAVQVTVSNGATYFLRVGSSAGAGGSRWAVCTPFFSIDGASGSVGVGNGCPNNPGGTPASIYLSSGGAICWGGSCPVTGSPSGGLILQGGAGKLTVNNLLLSNAVPTISSGFGTSPSVAFNNGSATLRVNVGTGGTATSGVVGLPTATNNWNCSAYNLTAHASNRADDTVVTTSNTTTVTVQNQTKSTGAAVAWTASDIVILNCSGE